MNTSTDFMEKKRNNSFAKLAHQTTAHTIPHILRNDLKVIKETKAKLKSRNSRKTCPKKKRRRFYKFKAMCSKVFWRRKNVPLYIEPGKFGNLRDTVDSELIHLLVYGNHNFTEDKPEKVLVITSDPILSILSRVANYKSVSYHSQKLSRNRVRKENPGKVYFFNKDTRTVEKYIEINDVSPLYIALDMMISISEHQQKCLKVCN